MKTRPTDPALGAMDGRWGLRRSRRPHLYIEYSSFATQPAAS